MPSESKPTVTYTLFLYCKELSRKKLQFLNLSRKKVSLTEQLISENINNLATRSPEDLEAINREILFRKELKGQMKRSRRLEKLGLKNVNPNELPSTDL